IGIVSALLARRIFVRVGIDPYVGPHALVSPSLALLATPVPWGGFFGGGSMADEPVVIVDTDREPRRRAIGRTVGVLIVGGAAVAVAVTLLQWETRPQTD